MVKFVQLVPQVNIPTKQQEWEKTPLANSVKQGCIPVKKHLTQNLIANHAMLESTTTMLVHIRKVCVKIVYQDMRNHLC